MVAPRVWARQTGLLEPKDACGRVVAHSEVTSQIAQSGDYSREVAICLGIGAKCVNSSAFSGTYFCSTVASTQEKHFYDNAVLRPLKQTTTTLPSFGRPPFSSECPRLFRYRERIGRRRRVRWLRDSSLPRNR